MDDERTTENTSHLRPGHVNLERLCDKLVLRAVYLVPDSAVTLPPRWSYIDRLQFRADHGEQMFSWAKTASYHLLLINGVHAFRAWTDSGRSCLVDVADATVPSLRETFKVLDIPASTRRKTKPFTKRVRITSERQMDIVVMQTMLAFGVL